MECQWSKLIDGNPESVRPIKSPCHAKNALQIRAVSLCQKMVWFLGNRAISEEREINKLQLTYTYDFVFVI